MPRPVLPSFLIGALGGAGAFYYASATQERVHTAFLQQLEGVRSAFPGTASEKAPAAQRTVELAREHEYYTCAREGWNKGVLGARSLIADVFFAGAAEEPSRSQS